MGTLCSKEDWTFEETEVDQIRRGEKPFTHPVVKLLIGKKIVKRRPVIGTPEPVNPVHLQGQKWRHVIVTVPKIEQPPVRPARRKKLTAIPYSESAGAASPVTRPRPPEPRSPPSDVRRPPATSNAKLLNGLYCSLQLRRYLRLAKTAIFITCERNSSLVRRRDLYRIFASRCSLANESPTTSKANAVLPILRNASLTNEPSDTYFQRYDDANTNGFKNFSPLTAERDLDKLKFWKMCRPLQLCRALPFASSSSSSSTINDANESGSTRFLDELTHRAEDVANNTKTNQNRNTANSRKSNIKKVWKRMKKNGGKLIATKRAAKEHSLFSPSLRQQVAASSYRRGMRPASQTCSPAADDYSSDCSISDSLSDFSTTL